MTDTPAGRLEVAMTHRDVPIRVCIVTGILIPPDKNVTHPRLENFLPKIDGVTRTLARLLDHLRETGHEALIVGPDNGLVFSRGKG
jgi:hypothetical protein